MGVVGHVPILGRDRLDGEPLDTPTEIGHVWSVHFAYIAEIMIPFKSTSTILHRLSRNPTTLACLSLHFFISAHHFRHAEAEEEGAAHLHIQISLDEEEEVFAPQTAEPARNHTSTNMREGGETMPMQHIPQPCKV